MIDELRKNSNNRNFFINVYNVNTSTNPEDISNFYNTLNIRKIITNKKPGNFDLVFDSLEEAINLVEIGNGVNYFLYFLINLIYENKGYQR